ncbi:prolyl-tRNA synthetase associated domain-containing protein [Streptococcus saliviloxodontae]|uniref:Ala-tRNA(Pro) deacylase n=1 Tax=Streptococcus saliviloxodontae TaxID=1349416 RepID=A0ABS2PKN7_9STRE|nr:prolyl-tRNA synthetase associated domain-containing protein [Streptococcus saliviloxodontae]MBM7635992.1 Ala-tRNA(Pro) deacylase [Streptococcus saliviloxodontae]
MVFATDKEAYDLLAKLDIAYDRLDHHAITSVHDFGSSMSGQGVKNLFLKNKKSSQFYLVILPANKQANLSALGEHLGEKRLSFASDNQLEELLHVPAGTVTPFGLLFDKERKIRVIVDAEVDRTASIGFHPFINTSTLSIAYADLECLVAFLGYQIEVIIC